MDHSDEKVIALSKNKLLLLILGSIAFVAAGAWLLSLEDSAVQSQRGFNDTILVNAIGIVTIVFFGSCGLYGIKKLFDPKPGLVFNSAGVVDNSSGVAAGLIPWSEITGADVFQVHGQKMLIIKVRNPQKYLERGNLFKQMLNKANHKMCGSPIAISANSLKISFTDLLELFEQYRRKYGIA